MNAKKIRVAFYSVDFQPLKFTVPIHIAAKRRQVLPMVFGFK